MDEAAEAWGGQNPIGVPLFVVTHQPVDAPSQRGFTFVDVLDEAITRARQAAGPQDVSVGGGAHVIRQAISAGHVDELAISIAPVILGGGKRLFDGFEQILNLEHAALSSRPSPRTSPVASSTDPCPGESGR